jgi:hydroxymethylpyrimidine pyrophosphatase-like HAD family hydrolase
VGDIGLVVTDLDGTLWAADERVHERTLAALDELASRDVPVLVATGRRLSSAVATLGRSGIQLPTVVLDGALGREVGPGRTFHRAAFPAADARAVLATFRAAGLSPCLYVDRSDAEVVAAPDTSTHPAHLAHVGEWLERADALEPVLDREQILMFAVVAGPEAALTRVARGVGRHGAAAVTRDIIYGGVTLTVRPPRVSKWDGVLAWCADQGLPPDRVLAVGDGHNDLELLDAARVACVVSDGCEPALALADHVLEPACDGGWSAILDLV